MGVKYLWSIVEPACKEKPVGELFGKRVAIDTSCWVVSDNQILPSHIAKPHLRNLFFRTASLLENGIDPVYVLEGQAPELKAQVMKKRREARFGTATQTGTAEPMATNKSNGRSRYNYIQKECTELLNALGCCTITSMGEAEAACAGLNHQGVVDGCITVDGDAFLYGAKTIYRNLSTDTSNFVCQEYSMDLIETRLNLSRDKLVAMAILFGCDYLPDGVPGVGKESALRVISTWKNGEALEILKSWTSEGFTRETIPLRPPHCSQCKHPGSLRGHAKSGCTFCEISSGGCNNNKQSTESCPCEWHEHEIRYEELAIREKVNSLKELDLGQIFTEFKNDAHIKNKGGTIPPWKMPSIQTFVNIATKKLKWEPQYAAEKILPLLCRWITIHNRNCEQEQIPVKPLRILKKRVKRGCPMYEIEWGFHKEIEHFPLLFNTLEPQFLVEKEFNHLIPTPVPKPLKVTRRKNTQKKLKSPKKQELDVVTMFKNMNIATKKTDVRASPLPSDASLLDLSGGTDDSDLSDIVESICNRAQEKHIIKKKHDSNRETFADQLPSRSIESILKPQEFDDADLLLGFRGCTIAERPLPNFSLNFSLDKFLESSYCDPEKLHDPSICSTPLKNPSDSQEKTEQDSFSTPSPLAGRFSRFKI